MFLTTPHATNLTSPHHTSRHHTTPHLTSLHLTSPRLTSPPHHTSPSVHDGKGMSRTRAPYPQEGQGARLAGDAPLRSSSSSSMWMQPRTSCCTSMTGTQTSKVRAQHHRGAEKPGYSPRPVNFFKNYFIQKTFQAVFGCRSTRAHSPKQQNRKCSPTPK